MFHISHYVEQLEAIQRIFARREVIPPEAKKFLCLLLEVDASLTDPELIRRLGDALQVERITQRLTS